MKKKLKAAALTYFKENLDVPVISALGEDEFARLILKQAEENGIKIINNEQFFAFRNKFKVGRQIPEEIYEIVAEILTSVIKEF